MQIYRALTASIGSYAFGNKGKNEQMQVITDILSIRLIFVTSTHTLSVSPLLFLSMADCRVRFGF